MRRKWLKTGLMIGGAFTCAAGLIAAHSTGWLAALGGTPDDERLEKMRESEQWDAKEKIFVNSVETSVMMPGTTLETSLDWFKKPGDAFPINEISTVRPSLNEPPAGGLRITWLGHSTTLIEIDGRAILIDPVFGERVSPSTLAGPRRFHPLPLDPKDLPELDGDGKIHCWGRDGGSLLDFPEEEGFVSLSVGSGIACAQRSDNTLECWGIPQFIDYIPDQPFEFFSMDGPNPCGVLAETQQLTCWGVKVWNPMF